MPCYEPTRHTPLNPVRRFLHNLRVRLTKSPAKARQIRKIEPVLDLVATALEGLLEYPVHCDYGVLSGVVSDEPGTWIPIFLHHELTEANIDALASQALVKANNMLKAGRSMEHPWPFSPAQCLAAAGATDVLFVNYWQDRLQPPEVALHPEKPVFRRYRVGTDTALKLVRDSRIHPIWEMTA